MKKTVYNGNEEGLYVFGTFMNYMDKLEGSERINLSSTQNDYGCLTIIGVWHYQSGITIRSSHICSKLVENPVGIGAFGEMDKINAFEKMISAEHERRKSLVKTE